MAKSKRSHRGPSIKNLQTGAHKGRPGSSRMSSPKPFVSPNGLAKLTAPAMMHKLSPTPSGPEPGHGGTTY